MHLLVGRLLASVQDGGLHDGGSQVQDVPPLHRANKSCLRSAETAVCTFACGRSGCMHSQEASITRQKLYAQSIARVAHTLAYRETCSFTHKLIPQCTNAHSHTVLHIASPNVPILIHTQCSSTHECIP